jgi:uncharacterized membrane protein YdcZ (DUF606 family)
MNTNKQQIIENALSALAGFVRVESNDYSTSVIAWVTIGGVCPSLYLADVTSVGRKAGATTSEIVNFTGNLDGSIFVSLIFRF